MPLLTFSFVLRWFRARQLPKRITWSDHVQAYYYEIDSETLPVSKPVQRIVKDRKRRFRTVLEAVSSNRRHVRNSVLGHYSSLLPRLQDSGFHMLSSLEMESKQHEIIDKLDNLRQLDLNDPDIAYVCTSEAYKTLEDQLLLLLEASECLAQKANIESLLSCMYDDSEDSNRVCLIFSIESKRVTVQRRGSFHYQEHSKNAQ